MRFSTVSTVSKFIGSNSLCGSDLDTSSEASAFAGGKEDGGQGGGQEGGGGANVSDCLWLPGPETIEICSIVDDDEDDDDEAGRL